MVNASITNRSFRQWPRGEGKYCVHQVSVISLLVKCGYPNREVSSAKSWVFFTKKGAFENIPPGVSRRRGDASTQLNAQKNRHQCHLGTGRDLIHKKGTLEPECTIMG